MKLLESGRQQCQNLLARYPSDPTLLSMNRQIDYLISLENGSNTDRSRLKDIILGVQAARGLDGLDESDREIFYKIDSLAQDMRRFPT